MFEPILFMFSSFPALLKGAVVAIAITLLSIALALALGVLVAFLRIYGGPVIQKLAYIYEWVLRGTPILVILFIIYFGLPRVHLNFGPFLSVVIGLGLRSSAYLAQVFRGAILSIGTHQMEAGLSIGLTKFQALWYVILPQTVRLAFPGFVNEFTIVLKDSPLAFAVGIAEILSEGRSIIVMTGRPFEVYLACSIVYFGLFYGFYYLFRILSKRFEIPGFAIEVK
jgi:polar amino acid transport system permease protein